MSLTRCLPAVMAALLVCFLPSCASLPPGFAEAAAAKAQEDARPERQVVLKPVIEGAPTCITRGAGMDFDPPSGEGLWPLAVFYLIVYLGYAIGWTFVRLGELIYEACTTPDEEEPQAQPARD